MALIVAMVLLLLITLVGLAAMRGTMMQQRMASNLYDRQVAIQNAEAAVRAATVLIPTQPALVWHNCQTAGTTCLPNPFNDSTLPSSAIHPVSAGTSAGAYTAGATAGYQPQYVVENMGNWVDQNANTGFGNTANSRNYGVQGSSSTAVYYRITARSGDPSVVKDRAVVILQAVIKQG
ncbi:pilus assembly PilX family protein [Dyella choica]|uniref:Pilus assembly protein n=1 Tax=Dyella choica TaxID=1927959 RepID=A0A3S0Q410_9GAMM|nr:PilX N-terminal domain-containing pilus assembly protein [Dyella choica]RUL74048.1 pilus assembly protein [Dyella choica]